MNQDFECPRCGHCCKSDLARVGEVGLWGECEPQEEVEDGWCDWVCPKPRGYLMQCCDCGLIHEVESRVAKYEPRPSEVFEVVDDPDLQVQWRMKRRDDISPKRPHQEPVATVVKRQYEDGTYAGNALDWAGRNCEDDFPVGTKLYTDPQPVKFNCTVVDADHPNGVPLSQWGKQQKQKPFCYHDGRNIVGKEFADHSDVFPLYTAPQPRQWQGLTDEEIETYRHMIDWTAGWSYIAFARAIEAKLKDKNQ